MKANILRMAIELAYYKHEVHYDSLDHPANERPYYQLIRILTGLLEARVYVEIGVDAGLAIEQAALGNPECSCVGVDPWIDWPAQYQEAWHRTEPINNVQLLRGFSVPLSQELWMQGREDHPLLPFMLHDVASLVPEKIDILFLDGWHKKDIVLEEMRVYGSRVPEGGLILLDDLHTPDMKGVWEVLVEGKAGIETKGLHHTGFGVIIQ